MAKTSPRTNIQETIEGAPMPPPYNTAAYVGNPFRDPQFDPAPYTPPVCRCPCDVDPYMAHTYVLNNHLASRKIKAGKHGFVAKGVADVVVAGEKNSSSPDYLMEDGDFDSVVEKYRHGRSIGSNYLYMDSHVATARPKEAAAGIDPWDLAQN